MRWAAASLGVAVFAAASPAPQPAGLPPGWFLDYPAARAESHRTNKPLLVMFHCER